jgi:hypothetical protein
MVCELDAPDEADAAAAVDATGATDVIKARGAAVAANRQALCPKPSGHNREKA